MNSVLLPLKASVLFPGSSIAGKYTMLDLGGPLTTALLCYFIAVCQRGARHELGLVTTSQISVE